MHRTLLCAAALIGIGACGDPFRPDGSAGGPDPTGTHPSVANDVLRLIGLRARDLGTLGGPVAVAIGTNERTQVVGWSTTSSDAVRLHPYLWTPEGGMRDLGTLGGDNGIAFEVNQRGDVVGFSDIAGNAASRAFLWTEDRGMRDLGTLGGTHSTAQGVNNRGQVVGDAQTADGRFLPFIWEPGRGLRGLDISGVGGSASGGRATSISEPGDVAGYIALQGPIDPPGAGPTRAFRWTRRGGIQDLGTLGGDLSLAWGINAKGDVVGQSSDASGASQAFLWTERHGMQGLGTLGGPYGNALSINTQGVVVGESLDESGGLLPFVWTRDMGMRQLPLEQVGGVGGAAVGINEKNEIAGLVFTADGGLRAVLWKPRGNLLVSSLAEPGGEFEVAPTGARRGVSVGWCKLVPTHGARGLGPRLTCPS